MCSNGTFIIASSARYQLLQSLYNRANAARTPNRPPLTANCSAPPVYTAGVEEVAEDTARVEALMTELAPGAVGPADAVGPAGAAVIVEEDVTFATSAKLAQVSRVVFEEWTTIDLSPK